MSGSFHISKWRMSMRFALLGATAMALAGCSSDSSRLGDMFGGSDRMATGSTSTDSLRPPDQIGSGGYQGGYQPPRGPVSAAPRMSSIQSSQLPPPSMPSRPVYSAPSTPSPHLSAAAARSQVATTATAAGGRSGPWTAAGGTAITVGQGDTATVLSNRYGVPQDALLKVNGLSSAAQIQPGTRLTIPVYSISNNEPAARTAPPAHVLTAPAAAPEKKPVHEARTAKPEPMKVAKAAELPKAKQAELAKQEAKAKALEAAKLKAAQAKPEHKVAEKPVEPVKPLKTAKVEKPVAEQPRRQQVDATPTNTVQPDADVKTAATVADDKPEFRWPARGRIIQGFKAGGNDGINIAVPEGTSVKAAESGVVAYAGSELKGYGNLVLIRHPNGYVSAYANNGALNVKRGETVKRGQTIATSGQSGNVATPQLHFELRKGSTPVDPSNYLAGL
ncbi:peptidoglycan DD-metalloendopeptidase family protein [Roseiarcaceae bacterium H3SJ34-1]|uniref:peptidoglycan DD-metalloendopeptidase family protein n=1 Tax=Terripilifer ovatus TaxID=3032367 RepID=UPI003AB9A584|nr:peptidoglycan DD-metalloendopeptidase family protein [Roseiarcaceae bacterium H3SJ34-1]